MGQVFSIPPEQPFLDALASGLLAQAGDDPLALARATILLPTRRAVRALGEAFLRAREGRALLLPRMLPVGDLDAEELALLGDESDAGGLDIPPAVPELLRRLMLTKLVLAWGQRHGAGPMTPGQAAPLAAALARFLDEVQATGGKLDALETLVPEEHAEHWQRVLVFLDIIRVHWPAALAEIGCLDPAERRNRVLAAQIAQWSRTPPSHPVIAAGLAGGVPAVLDLVAAVAALPQGTVVLPGVADCRDEETWGEITLDPAHPQHLMARLLRRLALDPAEVLPWPARVAGGASPERCALVFEAMRPASSSDRWRALPPPAARATADLYRIDCPGPQEEGLVIALLMREALETDGRTCALVTLDRDLARAVAAELRRWDIAVDDSAGSPLNRTPPGVFLRLVLDAVAEQLAPVPLLALLKHPLAALGMPPETCRALTRRLEIAVLRGPRPAPGVAGLAAALGDSDDRHALRPFVAALDAALEPLVAAMAAEDASLASLVAAHLAAAEALARSASETGAQRLWREPAGEAAALLASEFLQSAHVAPPLAGRDYPPLFEALLAGPVVRPPFGLHPRLFIWGLVEARLQHADRLILGALNEGVWPPQTESDPWLSRPMRQSFGMPPPEQRIGIAAHDFAQSLGAREVFLTRAAKVEGAPTVPSRWLLRLDAVLSASGQSRRLEEAGPLAWAGEIDRAPRIKPRAPAPTPPVAARPRRLSVTEIETWRRDPYAIYARRVLRLERLDPLDDDPGAAERGTYIHAALDRFLRECPGPLPPDAEARLLEFGRAAFGAALERPGIRAFWWPRFEAVARWFVANEAARRPLLTATAAECKGMLALAAPAGAFTLTARADRIDTLALGGLAIIDFKTGSLPGGKDLELGYAPQLPLEAAIAEAGGFTGIAAAPVRELAFWQLAGRAPVAKVSNVAKDAASLRRRIDEALAGLSMLIARFDDATVPYRAVPDPGHAPRYSDYTHLARVKEWSVGGERGE